MKKINFKDKMVWVFIIYLCVTCFTAFALFKLNILPMKFMILVIGLLCIISLLLGYAFVRKASPKLLTILTSMLCILMILGSIMVYKGDDTIRKIAQAVSGKASISLVVLKEDTATSLQDIKDASFGMANIGQTAYLNKAIEDIKKEINGDITLATSTSYKDLGSKLYNGTVRAILIDESSRALIEDQYADFGEKTKVIKTFEYKIEEKDISKDINVTKEPFSVYVTGIDTYGEITTVSRSDVNMIVSVNPKSKEILMVSIPRDYYIEQTCQANQKDKLTHTGLWGAECTLSSVENFFGIDLNYYVRINFSSVENIVDALGGVVVENPRTFSSGGMLFNAGSIELNGKEALQFSRERYAFADGDFERGRDQMRVLTGIINKLTSPSVITGYTSLLDAIGDSFQTNLSESEIKSLINMQLNDMAGWSIQQVSVAGERGYDWSPANGDSTNIVYPVMDSVESAKALINEFVGKK